MRLTRSHVALPLAVGASVALPEDAAAHLVRVLRLQAGDACVLFNGDGNDYDARLTEAGKRGAQVEILGCRANGSESPLRITLLQGIARGEKMDWILQKATELGVAGIQPVVSERSEVRLDAPRAERRLAHWREVVIAACEQSGRAVLPELAPPQPLAQAAGTAPGLRLLLDPDAEQTLQLLGAETVDACTLAIGPEGGWSPRDLATLRGEGFRPLRFGPRVLRTETAALAAIAALQLLRGDLAG